MNQPLEWQDLFFLAMLLVWLSGLAGWLWTWLASRRNAGFISQGELDNDTAFRPTLKDRSK